MLASTRRKCKASIAVHLLKITPTQPRSARSFCGHFSKLSYLVINILRSRGPAAQLLAATLSTSACSSPRNSSDDGDQRCIKRELGTVPRFDFGCY